MERLTGGTKKGVFRLRLDDGTTVIQYVWSESENHWPPGPEVPDDPFSDASGPDLFVAAHAALTRAGVRVPRLIEINDNVALVEDAGSRKLEDVEHPDLHALAEILQRMHAVKSPRYGKVAANTANQERRPEDIIQDRALLHLDAGAARDRRLAETHERLATLVRQKRDAVQPRADYRLIHGELGPDHVLVKDGELVVIDIEGCAYFDVEWEHAWLEMRFGDDYPALRRTPLDQKRLEFYRYAQALSLIEGPLRIADTDYPGAQWMRELAEYHIGRVLTW